MLDVFDGAQGLQHRQVQSLLLQLLTLRAAAARSLEHSPPQDPVIVQVKLGRYATSRAGVGYDESLHHVLDRNIAYLIPGDRNRTAAPRFTADADIVDHDRIAAATNDRDAHEERNCEEKKQEDRDRPVDRIASKQRQDEHQ